MELHRARFFTYVPTAVNALAFSPDGEHVAVARANADIELWHVGHDWLLEKRIAGAENSSVESLLWTPDKRLFSAGHHAFITEWDTLRLQPKTSSDSYGGAVWSIAVDAAGTTLAAGCEDGSVRLFDVSDGSLRYIRALEGQRGRVLSVAWSANGTMLASGSAEGTIRLWNVPTARTIKRMTVPSSDPKGPALIWSVSLLPDDTLVSGDSQGNVTFWDGESGTVLQSILSHSADVLTVTVTKDGRSIYAAGIDNKVVHIRSLESAAKWVISGTKRQHTHDVRALALSPSQKTLVSGGVDTNIVVYSTGDFGKSGTRTLPPFPHKPLVAFARTKRILCCMYPRYLELWAIGQSAPVDTPLASRPNHSVLPLAEPHGKLAELRVKGGKNIVCCAVSDDGQWLAVADSSVLKIFRLEFDEDDGHLRFILLNNLPDFDPAISNRSALAVAFSPDSQKLVAAHHDGSISIVSLRDDEDTPAILLRVLTHHRDSVPYDKRETICTLAISADAQWLVTADCANRIYVLSLDTLKLNAALPTFASRHTALAFHEASGNIIVACADNTVYAYHVDTKHVREITCDTNSRLTHLLRRRKEKISGILSNPSRPNTIILWGLGYLCELDIRKELASSKNKKSGENGPITASQSPAAIEQETVTNDAAAHSVKLVHAVQPCLYLDFAAGNELVAVQRPWIAVMENFPPKLHRTRYGA